MPTTARAEVYLLLDFVSQDAPLVDRNFATEVAVSTPMTTSTLLQIVTVRKGSFFDTSDFPVLKLSAVVSRTKVDLPFTDPRTVRPPVFPTPVVTAFVLCGCLIYF